MLISYIKTLVRDLFSADAKSEERVLAFTLLSLGALGSVCGVVGFSTLAYAIVQR